VYISVCIVAWQDYGDLPDGGKERGVTLEGPWEVRRHTQTHQSFHTLYIWGLGSGEVEESITGHGSFRRNYTLPKAPITETRADDYPGALLEPLETLIHHMVIREL
jgi:hypothetical protein